MGGCARNYSCRTLKLSREARTTNSMKTPKNTKQPAPASLAVVTRSPLISEIRARIKEQKAFMRINRIRRISFMNPGLTPDEYSANKDMFSLETELQKAIGHVK